MSAEVERLRADVRAAYAEREEMWERKAAALRERDEARRELAEARRERDLAIAHDRQPYPTAWAYEQACKALEKHRARANQAEAKLFEVAKVRVWTNEDGKRFVFADDLAAILRPDLNTPTPTTRTETP